MFFKDMDTQEVVSAWRFRAKWEKDHWWLVSPPPWLSGGTVQFLKNPDGFLFAEFKKDDNTIRLNPSDYVVLKQDGSLTKYSHKLFEATYKEATQ